MQSRKRSRWMQVLKRAPQFYLLYENEFGMRFTMNMRNRCGNLLDKLQFCRSNLLSKERSCSADDYGISIWVTASRELITKIRTEAIEYMRHHADVLQEFLDNNMNNNTHEWTRIEKGV